MATTDPPQNERWIRFEMGTAFPADSPVARFVAGMAMIGNDLTRTNSSIVTALEEAGSSISLDGVQLFWVAISQYREAVKFLDKASKQTDVAEFIGSLAPADRNHFEVLEGSYAPWQGSFVHRVSRPVRNDLYHYPDPDDSEWIATLRALAAHRTGIQFKGLRIADTRSVFADHVRAAFLTRHLGTDTDEIRDTMATLAKLSGHFVEFSQIILTVHLQSLPVGTYELEQDAM